MNESIIGLNKNLNFEFLFSLSRIEDARIISNAFGFKVISVYEGNIAINLAFLTSYRLSKFIKKQFLNNSEKSSEINAKIIYSSKKI